MAWRWPHGRAGSSSPMGFTIAPLHHRSQGLAGAQPSLPHLEQPISEASSCFCARMGVDEPEGGFPAGDELGANRIGRRWIGSLMELPVPLVSFLPGQDT